MPFKWLSWLARPWLLKTLVAEVRLAWRLLREPMVPLLAKAVLPLWGVYLVSPVDALPDIFPGIGQLDDFALAFAALKLFLRFCPPAAVAFHRAELAARRPFSRMTQADTIIEAEFRPR